VHRIVLQLRTPVMPATMSLKLSTCCALTVVYCACAASSIE